MTRPAPASPSPPSFSSDTIAAIATPSGIGSVGIVRASGPDAFAIADRLTRSRRPVGQRSGHTLFRAYIHDTHSGATIDDGLMAVFHAPRSFTGEHIVEFQGHGGLLVIKQVFEAFLQAGARPARPGEFSERAFANGRLDLAQAEAIAALITAQTGAQVRAARRQLEGKLGFAIQSCTGAVQEALAFIEASIDFPEEMGDLDTVRVSDALRRAQSTLASLLQGASYGRRLQDGVTLVLVGAPNAGKSSLLNALAGTERAIVTPHAGTTRDVLEEPLQIGGIPVRGWDTAGLRATDDPIETIGIERAQRALADADLVVLVVDATVPLPLEIVEVLRTLGTRPALVALNKSDLATPHVQDSHRTAIASLAPHLPIVALCAANGDGLEDFSQAVVKVLTGTAASDPLVTSARHEEALRAASQSLTRAQTTLADGLPAELIAVDAHAALHSLGEITGETAREDIIRGIFARFCIGK